MSIGVQYAGLACSIRAGARGGAPVLRDSNRHAA